MSLSQENNGGDSESLRSQSVGDTNKSCLFKSQLHTNNLLNELHSMRKQNILCNITFKAGNTKIHAHRAVLASCSPYFRTMFVANISDQASADINFDGVESHILEQVIDYLYSGEIRLTEQNVTVILSLAHTLEITEVVHACSDFFVNQLLIPSKCFSIRALVKHYRFNSLEPKVDSFIRDHFSQVIEEKEYLELPINDISDLIQDDNIVISDEEQVFSCVMKWVKYDIENRKSFLPSLMKHIRLPLVKHEFLAQKLKEERLIREIPECLDDVVDTLSCIQLHKGQYITNTSKRTTPRQSFQSKAIMMIDTSIQRVECYEFRSCSWVSLNRLPMQRQDSAIATVDGLVFLLGGSNYSRALNTVDMYNPINNEWEEDVPPMISERRSFGAATLYGKIYAVGGKNSTGASMNNAEVLDLKSESWISIAPMVTPRQQFGLAAVNNRLYAVGGYDGKTRLRTVECYDPEADKWHFVSEMSCSRTALSVGVLNGLLYAVGGYDGEDKLRSVEVYDWNTDSWRIVTNMNKGLRSVEVYDPNTDSWRFVADMNKFRVAPGVISHHGKLYAVGGIDETSIEVYFPRTDTWTLLEEKTPFTTYLPLVSLINRPLRFE